MSRNNRTNLPSIVLPTDVSINETAEDMLLRQQRSRSKGDGGSNNSALSRFRKVGWCKKTGVVFKNPTRPGVPLTDVEVRELVGADRSTTFTVMPPPLSLGQLQVVSNVKTRFLLLLEHRLQYGSTSTFEAFQRGGTSACASEILGELFLTGDAWARPVDATSIVVCGDPAMMKKTGKLYLLTFTSTDIRVEWELAFHFFLFRAVPSERMERLLLSGWISAFPNLGTKMHRVVGRRMSIVANRSSLGGGGGAAATTPERTLPPRFKKSSSATITSQADTTKTTVGGSHEHEDEDDEVDDTIGNVVSSGDDDDDSSSEGSEAESTTIPSVTQNQNKLTKKNSEMSAAFQSFMFSKRHRHVVDAAGDVAPANSNVVPGASTAAGASSTDPLVTYAQEEMNTNGMHFLLRCQRSSSTSSSIATASSNNNISAASGGLGGRNNAAGTAEGAGGDHYRTSSSGRPQPTYLCIQWQRTSHTIHAVPVLRETSDPARAARFALRSFAESAGQYSPQRVVPVDAPSWQLYTRSSGGGGAPHDDPKKESGEEAFSTTERELILRPVFPMTTLPSPTVVTAGAVGSSAAGIASSSTIANIGPAAAGVGHQPWAFRARWWEGSARSDVHSPGGPGQSLASFSFLLEGSVTRGALVPAQNNNPFSRSGGAVAAAAVPQTELIVALSTIGKMFIIPSDHADGGGGSSSMMQPSLSSFVPLEAVPATSDAEIQFHLAHQSPAMRERALFRAATRALSTNFLQQGLLEPFRIILVGASGSGKSTLAHWVDRYSLHHNHQQHASAKAAPASNPNLKKSNSATTTAGGGGGVAASADTTASSVADDISKRIHTINCNGIAVPVVITDVPSSASAAYIRTQCTGADVVLCMFDVSDEHSLHWLEANMAAICADAKDELSNHPNNKGGNHHLQRANSAARHDDEATADPGSGGGSATAAAALGGLPRALPRTKFVLCATRVDSLRVAVDSYRLEAFRSATEVFTGPASLAWLPPIETIFACSSNVAGGNATGLAGGGGGGGGPPSLTALGSAHSFASSSDESDASPPFSQFGTRWRMWRLPTATRETSAPVARELQALLAEGNLSESFLFSPNLKRLAAEGAILAAPQAGGSPTLPPALRRSGASNAKSIISSTEGEGENVSFGSKDPLASTQKEKNSGSDAFRDRSPPQESGVEEEDDEDNWKVPKHMMQCLGGVLEELYLVRIGKSLGWSEAMVSRFAVASCVATMDARQEDADAQEERRIKEERARMLGEDTTIVKSNAAATAHHLHDGSGHLLSSRIVTNLFHMLHLPKSFQYDVVREVLHTPKVTRQRGGERVGVGGGDPSVVLSPTTTRTPQRQSTRWAGGMSDGTATPQISAAAAAMDASTLLLNSSISAIGSESIRKFTASFAMQPLLSPLSLTTSKFHATTVVKGAKGTPQLDQSVQLFQQTTMDGADGTLSSLAAMMAKYPVSDQRTQNALLMTTPGLPPALMPLISSTNSNPSTTTRIAAAAPPTWKEVIACSLRQWHEHWLVFRWIAASAAAGDVRAELIMGMLRGEHDEFTFLPTANQKRAILRESKHAPPYVPVPLAAAGGGGGQGGGPQLAVSTTTTTTVPLVKLPHLGITEDNDAMSVALVRSLLLRELRQWGGGGTKLGGGGANGSGGDSLSQSGSSTSAGFVHIHHSGAFGENRSTSSGSETQARRDDDEDEDVSSVLSNQTLSMSINYRRRLWLPITTEPAAASLVNAGGGHGSRVFHPTDLMYIAFGCHVPRDSPPVSIPDAALWVYQQPQYPWSDHSLRRTAASDRGGRDGGAGIATSVASSRFGHVSPVMLETMFWMVGIDMRRDHTSRLLRWADTNGDRLTDASDFMRWFTLLLFGLSAQDCGHHSSSSSGAGPSATTRPTDDPLGGGAAVEVDAAVVKSASGTAGSSPVDAAVVTVGSSYLVLLSTLWTLRTYHWVPMLEALSTACRSGLPKDRAWAAAASAHALHVPPTSFHSVLAVFQARGGGGGSGSGGAGGGDDCEWDDETGKSNTQLSGGGRQRNGGGDRVASTVLSRMAAALFGKPASSPLSPRDSSSPTGDGTSSSTSSCCHRCRMTFRALFRPATECQQCHNHFCSRCCKSIIVLNDSNKTEKRKLCLTCRRTHSTFLDDYDDENVAATTDAASKQQQQLSPTLKESRHSSATLESLDTTGGGGMKNDSPRNHHSATTTATGIKATTTTTSHVVWEDDAQTSCSICASTFTVLRRRHHCRLCGALVCGACSPHTIMLKDFVGPQRMCVSCFQGRRALEMNQERRRNFMSQQHNLLNHHSHHQPGTNPQVSTSAGGIANEASQQVAGWKHHSSQGVSQQTGQSQTNHTSAAVGSSGGGGGGGLPVTTTTGAAHQHQQPPQHGPIDSAAGSTVGSPSSPNSIAGGGGRRNSNTLRNASSSASFDEHASSSIHHQNHNSLERGFTNEDRQLRKQRWHALERVAAAAALKRQEDEDGDDVASRADHAAGVDEWAWLHAARALLMKDGDPSLTSSSDPTARDKRSTMTTRTATPSIVVQPWYETYSMEDERKLIEAARVALEEQARTVEYLLSMPGGKAAIEAERGPTWSYAVYQPGWFAAHDSALEGAYSAQQLEEMGPDVGPH